MPWSKASTWVPAIRERPANQRIGLPDDAVDGADPFDDCHKDRRMQAGQSDDFSLSNQVVVRDGFFEAPNEPIDV
jgi:hypothetical protein